MVEYGWGGRVLDVDNWQSEEVTWGPSMWGHDRLWMTPEKRVEARAIRVEAASTGLRKPVNVIEGNYKLAPGRLPVVGRRAARRGRGVASTNNSSSSRSSNSLEPGTWTFRRPAPLAAWEGQPMEFPCAR